LRSTALLNEGDGIVIEANHCDIRDNSVEQNEGRGISLPFGSGNRVEGNLANMNAGGGIVIFGSENLVVRNVARANLLEGNFAILTTNEYGPIEGVATSTSVWANLTLPAPPLPG
jgi:parallel beta-helix repeat protein